MEKQYGLSDQVIARIAQIIQEAMMLGIDAVDLLRQIKMKEDGATNTLVLTDDYKRTVKAMHDKLLEDAERLQQQQSTQSGLNLYKE
jgi:hypothetical protein